MRPPHPLLLVAILAASAAAAGYAGWRMHRAERAGELRRVDVGALCPGASSLGAPCAPCVAAHCCREMSACFGDAECIDLNDCWVSSGEDEGQGGDARSRARACLKKHEAKRAAFSAWDTCARKYCEDVCPRGPEEE